MITLLTPENRFPAIEERYGQWQAELLLSGNGDVRILRYDPDTPLQSLVADLQTEHVAVLTNPLIVCERTLLSGLVEVLAAGDAFAVTPSADLAGVRKADVPRPYLTLRQFEEVAAEIRSRAAAPTIVEWTDEDPALFVARTSDLRTIATSARAALRGRPVAVAKNHYIHIFVSQRGQPRLDLLERIPANASRVLEFGCGEGALAAALKQRQQCRVVGVELDTAAAAIARPRVDELVSGDVRAWIENASERFDFIVGGDVLEHLDEPWSFLTSLRKLAEPGAGLLLSLPNIANFSIVNDLLRGRFDYVYLGILCAGHLRFFTRNTIEDMLVISGWKIRKIEPQEPLITPEYEELIERLTAAGMTISREQLAAPGWYVHAEV